MNIAKKLVEARYEELVTRTNKIIEGNGVYNRYCNPVITCRNGSSFLEVRL